MFGRFGGELFSSFLIELGGNAVRRTLISFDEQIVNFEGSIAVVRTIDYNMNIKISERWCFIWQQNQRIFMFVLNQR